MKILNNIPTFISYIGAFTIIQYILYRSQKYEYEKVTILDISDNINENLVGKNIGYEIDFSDLGSNYLYIKTYLIKSEDTFLKNLKFYFLESNLSDYKKTKIKIKLLEPDTYLLIKVPVADMYGYVKMDFLINYKRGRITFEDNLKNGINNKYNIKVKKTFLSFINK